MGDNSLNVSVLFCYHQLNIGFNILALLVMKELPSKHNILHVGVYNCLQIFGEQLLHINI